MRADAPGQSIAATIPVVDFAGMDVPTERAATAAQLSRALETFGFCYVRHHGVPQPVLDALFAQSHAFFSLPAAAKEQVRPADRRNTLGYGGVGSQALDETRPADLKETFQASPEAPWARPNAWPADLPGFREAVLAFHTAASAACMRLMAALAHSLGLPEDHFAPYFDASDSTARLLHYPPLPATLAPGQIRAGAHTDFGGLNLLFNDGEGGLEIQLPDGTWLPAPALPGAGILNTGDLIERWSNGQFRSSPHRVVNPAGASAARDRYSAVLFHSPNRDALIECLPPCQGPARPARFPPITAGQHMQARIEASRRHNPNY